MSEGKKVALALGAFWVLVIGAVVALVGLGSDDGDASEDATTPTITRPTPPEPGDPTEYVVQPGETLSGIAVRFGVTLQTIIDENGITNPDDLRDGTVLVIPPAPPVWLEVEPFESSLGEVVEFTLTGAKSGETVSFEITGPTGTHVGPPHTASEDGTVTTTYRTSIAGEPGIYTVVATGLRGTVLEAQFQVGPEQR